MPGPYLLGAIPSPRHLAFAAIPHRITGPYPPSFLVCPKELDIWGNATYGCCVSSEEMAAKAMYSVLYGSGTELFIDPATMIAWARKHGVLNGFAEATGPDSRAPIFATTALPTLFSSSQRCVRIKWFEYFVAFPLRSRTACKHPSPSNQW